MAGSLNHIVADDGTFTMDLIENLDDAQEALEECHQIIAYLLINDDVGPDHELMVACKSLAFPVPPTAPVVQPELHGAESVWRR